MTRTARWVPNSTDDRMVGIQVRLARNAKSEQFERARRAANRISSILGIAASVVSMYDLLLLTRVGH